MPRAPTTAAKGKATIAEAAPALWELAGGGGGSQSHGRRQSGDKPPARMQNARSTADPHPLPLPQPRRVAFGHGSNTERYPRQVAPQTCEPTPGYY